MFLLSLCFYFSVEGLHVIPKHGEELLQVNPLAFSGLCNCEAEAQA
jgi:hypothetical protein